MLLIFLDLSPRKVVIQAVLPICHSVNAELETFLCGDCALINMSSTVHVSGACHPIYLPCNWLFALPHHVSLIFQFGVLQCTLWNPITLTYSCGSIILLENGILVVLLTSFPHFPRQGFHFCHSYQRQQQAKLALPSLTAQLSHFSDEHWKC